MDFRIVWSPEAVEDLDAIYSYIGRDSKFYAKAVVSKIVESARNLDRFPFKARIVPELRDENIRECFIYSYRLIYRIEEQRILIVAIIHGKRLIEPTKKKIKNKIRK